MHESMIAKSLLDAICEESARRKARPIAAKISCGTFNAINDDVFEEAFRAIAQGTICEQVKLQIEHKPIEACCQSCQKQFIFEIAKPVCAYCGSDRFTLLPDAPLLLEELEFEVNDE